MATVRQEKVVSALPGTLTADTIYYVRTGTGFRVFVTNHSGTVTAYALITDAGLVATDALTWKVLEGSTLQDVLNSADTSLLNVRSTGVRYGGVITGLGTTTASISAGAGAILDNTDPTNPTYARVTWAAQTITGLTTQTLLYVYVDMAGTVQSTTTKPTPDLYRTRIYLGRISVAGGTGITGLQSIGVPTQQQAAGIRDTLEALGTLKSGLEVTTPSANLTFSVASGGIYSPGGNQWTNPLSPHVTTFTATSPTTFRTATRTGAQTVDRTALDPSNYDAAGTITAVPNMGGLQNGRATIQVIYRFPSGNTRVLYGQGFYDSLDAAKTNISTYSPILPPGFDTAVPIAFVALTRTATNLQDPAQAFVVVTSRFGAVAGGALAQAGSYLEKSQNLADLPDKAAARAALGVVIPRTLAPATTASLGVGQVGFLTLDVTTAPVEIEKLTADRACHVRFYETDADRTADASAFTTNPAVAPTGYYLAAYSLPADALSVAGGGVGLSKTPVFVAVRNSSATTGTITLTVKVEDK